jgi:peptide deformylase
MARLTIVLHPDPRLRVVTRTVVSFDTHLQTLINDMFETMYHAENGVGLAATQVGEDLRLAVLDVSPDKTEPLVLINPEILEAKDETLMGEGCLSVPGTFDKVKRYDWIRFKAQDREGRWYEKEATGLFAECVQHEIDHLNGYLYFDQLSRLKQERLLRKYAKFLDWDARSS